MKAIAIRNIDRADPQVIQRLGAAGVATVHKRKGAAVSRSLIFGQPGPAAPPWGARSPCSRARVTIG